MAVLILGAAPVISVEIPASPDGTVRTVIDSLADHHPEVVWQALPPSYQSDITMLTHAYAERMDPTVWDAGFAVCRKAVGLLRDKKDIILSGSLVESVGDKRQDIEDGWDPAMTAMDAFFSSDVSRLDAMKTIDWEGYLATTGKELLDLAAEAAAAAGNESYKQEYVERLRGTTVETLAQDGDAATVRITAPDEDPEEIELTRVEGRWVPADMAAKWDEGMEEARQRLATLTDEEIQQSSTQAMMFIGMVDGLITQLDSAETSEEFEQMLQGMLGPFLGGGMEPDMPTDPAEEEPQPSDA
jgi:hypothetical protein